MILSTYATHFRESFIFDSIFLHLSEFRSKYGCSPLLINCSVLGKKQKK